MNYFLSIVAGAIQGITEFLPISSSGHLALFHDIFHFNLPDNLFFDVTLHWGTLAALLLFFYKDIEKIIRGFFSSLANWNLKNNYNQRLAWLMIIGTIPAAILGYCFEDLISNNLRSPKLVAFMLIAVGLLFWLAEKYAAKKKEIQDVNKFEAFLIGCAQAVALIPGVSRSGITIISGLGLKLKREEAARFSFLLSLPIVFAAGVKKFLEIPSWQDLNFIIMALGFLSAAVFGYLAIKYLLRYLENHSLNVFAWYRLIIGCLMLIWLFLF